MGDYCYSGILFAVLFQQLFDFACTETNIQRLLLHVLSVHKVHYAFCFLVVVFTLNFRKELEVLCLILQWVIFDEPKLTFRVNPRKIKLRKIFLFQFQTPTNIWTMLKSLTKQRFHNSGNLNIGKYQRACLQSSLKRRYQYDFRVQIFQFLACLCALHEEVDTSNLPFWDRWQSICLGL